MLGCEGCYVEGIMRRYYFKGEAKKEKEGRRRRRRRSKLNSRTFTQGVRN